MKKHVLTILGVILSTSTIFAQFSASSIWNLNQYVDPMPHNTMSLAGITMGGLTYNQRTVPTAGLSTNGAPMPKFRITSTVTGNKLVCISSEQGGSDPWEDKERATFENDGTYDTALTVEKSNNGSPFALDAKIITQRGSNPNQYTLIQYRYLNNEWKLDSKLFYYLSNGRKDSVVGFRYTGLDSSKQSSQEFYYSTGLDSVLIGGVEISTNQFVIRSKYIITQKENGKTKIWSIQQRETTNVPFQTIATVVYGNGTASSIKENELNSAFSIYPNPATETIQIALNQGIIAQTVSILDLNGQIVEKVSNNTTLDISNLANGIYLLQIESEKGIATQKFIKQ